MLGLQLRDEFRGKRLKGTTVDFKNQSGTGALDVTASDFLKITYPSHDLLKTIEATGPGQSRPVVLLGARGQGKSHLMAALYHLCHDPGAGSEWLSQWASHLKNSHLATLKLRNDCFVIAESLHLQRYKYLWDILFKLHPRGQWYEAKWLGMGDKKTDVPSYDLMMEMFTDQPTVLILDEFQTSYEGLTNTKQYPWRNWAFNFIQILSEIDQKDPDKLVLVVSVREGNSDAYQQIRRVNPVDVDFLDGVSLRETPWLLGQAIDRGYTIHRAGPLGTELPCETSPFAKALGFAQRSALENNGAGGAHKLTGAATESSNLNWKDCIGLVGNQQHVVFWHHFPDARMHDLSVPGEGLHKLAREAHEHFTSDAFWAFVERLATGRRLVITSDHGYAACGLFPDLVDKDQIEYMKKLFKSGRTATSDSEDGAWVPPIDLRLVTSHGSHRHVLGRRKWKSSGGYPTLHHGGLSLLEVFVPFIELSK